MEGDADLGDDTDTDSDEDVDSGSATDSNGEAEAYDIVEELAYIATLDPAGPRSEFWAAAAFIKEVFSFLLPFLSW